MGRQAAIVLYVLALVALVGYPAPKEIALPTPALALAKPSSETRRFF
jgi:hypothetical protein